MRSCYAPASNTLATHGPWHNIEIPHMAYKTLHDSAAATVCAACCCALLPQIISLLASFWFLGHAALFLTRAFASDVPSPSNVPRGFCHGCLLFLQVSTQALLECLALGGLSQVHFITEDLGNLFASFLTCLNQISL